MNHFFIKSGALLCATTFLASVRAETSETIHELDDFVVFSGSTLNSLADYAAPVGIIDEQALQRSTGGSLAAALDWQPGVSSSAFSSGASRPILRGFDGPRVRILNSGIESLDASSISPDHGTAIEPLLTDSVEILRGPSTLLYGSSAIGGAVNVIYGSIAAMSQTDLKYVIGYSSVSHMGYVFLGLATLHTLGVTGAVLQMFSHGVMTALMFTLAGAIYSSSHTRDIGILSGLAKVMPVGAFFFAVAGFASLGLPGFSGFVAELLVTTFVAGMKVIEANAKK